MRARDHVAQEDRSEQPWEGPSIPKPRLLSKERDDESEEGFDGGTDQLWGTLPLYSKSAGDLG